MSFRQAARPSLTAGIRQAARDGDKYLVENFKIRPSKYPFYYLYALERYHSFRALAVGRVEREPNRLLRAWADPERSDFRRADEVWEFSEEAEGTRVVYKLTIHPLT